MARDRPGRPKISDLVSQLGLKAAYTKRKDDWKVSPFVQEMYEKDLQEVILKHHTTPMDLIPSCPRVRTAAMALTEKYGLAIWPKSEHRPWLFNPGGGSPSALYARHLFYTNAQDRKFIQELMYELIVQKVQRWRKDKIRSNNDQRDSTWSPVTSFGPTLRTQNRSLKMHTLNCWAADRMTGANGGEDPHFDANGLKEAGVWLGSYDEEKEVVNGPSFDEVTRAVFVDTLGGTRRSSGEPHVAEEPLQSDTLDVKCAACQAAASSGGVPLQAMCISFDWEEKETETFMDRNIWTFKCKLNSKDVFAILKDEGPQAPNSSRRLFSFCRVNGGYTKSILLLTDQPQSRAIVQISRGTKRRRSDSHQSDGRATPSNQLIFRRFGSATTESSSASDVPFRAATALSHFTSINSSAGKARQKTLPFQDLPYRMPDGESQEQQEHAPQTSKADLAGHSERDSLYDTTPRPQLAQNEMQLARRQTLGRTVSPPLPPPDTSNNRAMSAPTFTFRFRLWLTTSWCDVRRVIMLNDGMDVADVFDSIEAKLARILDGRAATGLRIWLGDRQADVDNYIDIDVNDVDGWESILEHAKGSAVSEMHGTLTRED